MINIIRKEPVIKKSIFIMMMSIIVIFSIFTVFQYNNLKNIYLEQENINKRVVGILVNKYPQQEVDIVKSIYKQDNRYLDLGAKTLDKYGYDNNYNMYENVNFKERLKYFLVNNLTVFVIIIILVSFIVFNFTKYMYNRLLKVNSDIENIINNKYIAQEEFKEEGVFNRIYTDLNKLSRSLNLKISSLDKEKESIKELVTDISHQLKTPLASLKLYNTLLIEEELDDEDRIEFLKTNEMSINKLHNLIDSLVNISRLEASMINIKIENKSIKQTLIKAINSTVPKANQKNININIEDFEDIEIPHDTKWTEESIFNVLENAVKYGVEQALDFCTVILSAKIENGILIISVENDGSEAPEDLMKMLYQGEKKPQGHGIGLINIDKRTKLLFGSEYGISVESSPDLVRVLLKLPFRQK